MRRAVLLSTLCTVYLCAANNDPQNIVNEVSKLRQKYEECRQQQTNASPSGYSAKIQGYQKRIADLEGKLEQNARELLQIKKRTTEAEREILQKRGVIQSLEQTLTARDKNYRAEVAHNEMLTEQTNTAKVSRIERKNLTDSLNKAKFDIERLENVIAKTAKERTRLEQELSEARGQVDKFRTTKTSGAVTVQEPKKVLPVSDQSGKIKALQNELSRANALILELQNAPKPSAKEKVVYRDRPIVQERVVEKVVYKDRPVIQEKIVEKVVVKSNDATEKLNRALQQKLAENEAQMEKLKAKTAKLVPPKTTKMAVQSVAVPEKTSKVLKAPESKVPVAASSTSTGKKSAPSAYRMATNAPVYNAPGGSVVDTWEARRSFTSGTVSNGWIKITGYFVNRVWQRADEELWVKESDVIRR